MSNVSTKRTIRYTHIPEDAMMLVANPPVLNMPCRADGTNKLSSLTTMLRVMKGGSVDSGWTFNIDLPQSCSASIKTSGNVCTLTVSSVTADNAVVEMSASKGGVELFCDILITRTMAGDTGAVIPPPMRWSDYPDDYVFQSGNVDAGEERQDVVFANTQNPNDGTFNAYFCIQTHRKSSVSNIKDYDFTKDTQRWKASDTQGYQLISTQLLLANNAFINMLGVNGMQIWDQIKFGSEFYSYINGAFTSLAGAHVFDNIRLPFFLNGKVFQQESGPLAGGKNEEPKLGIDEQGRIYSGGLSGQHIEIDPIEKTLKVFDEQGSLCAIHSGREIPIDEAIPKSSNKYIYDSSTFNRAIISSGKNSFGYETEKRTVMKDGQVTINVPSAEVTVSPGSLNGSPLPVKGHVYVYVYIGSHQELISQTIDTSTGRTLNIQAKSVTVNAKAGDTVYVKFHYQITPGLVETTPSVVDVKFNEELTIEISANVYMCEYASNGLRISTSGQNYFYFLFDKDGQLHARAVSNGNILF